MTKRVIALLLILVMVSVFQLSMAECAHSNVSHHKTIYHNYGVNGHTSMTACQCNDCGKILGCHPATGESGFEEHTYRYVTDWHGADFTHYIRYTCRYCGAIKLVSYHCSGNPCISPLSIDLSYTR